MRKTHLYLITYVSMLFLLGSFASAQDFGSITGTVRDADGAPLPGVSITLNGAKIAPMTVVSTAAGNFRFLNLPVASDFNLKFELEGFTTYNREMLVVSYGKDLDLDIIMDVAELSEEVTVVGQAPTIDTKRTQVGVNITKEMLMQLPTARNPWVIMEMIPGMLVDRMDVGGNEGGQQSNYWGQGSKDTDNTWNVDGANVTDNSALGAAPAYLNMASYEEVNINYGNNDVKAQTGGVQINLVTKRGGNDYSGTFYMDLIRNAWQSDNVSDELKDAGYTAGGINRLYLYGANFGGPIARDRAWFYGSWGIQDIDKLTLANTSDKTWLASGYGRLDFQVTPSTRANVFVSYDNKQKWGRTWLGATQQDAASTWNQGGPGYIYKGEIEQSVGNNLYLDVKVMYTDGGFELDPLRALTEDGSGEYLVWERYPSLYMSGTPDHYFTNRDSLNFNLSGNYFLENLAGTAHEFKFGVDYQNALTNSTDRYEGNLHLNYWGPSDILPTGEEWEAWVTRDYVTNYAFRRYSAYLQDTMTFGRVAVNLGLRYDYEKSLVKDVDIPASMFLSTYLPAVSIDEYDPGVNWSVLSPRLSLTYDLFGNGKDVLKFSAARYGSQSGETLADFVNPVGWSEIDVYWQDMNGDKRVTEDELYGFDWDTGELKDPNDPDYWLWSSSSVNPDDPTSLEPLNQFDAKYNSPLLDELSAAYQKEIFTDFVTSFEFFYKRQHRNTWTRSMMADGTLETEDNYYEAGVNEEVGQTYYGRNEFFPYLYRTNHANAYDRYIGAQIVFNKRLSRGWMLYGAVTWSDWRKQYKDEYLGIIYDTMYDAMTAGLNNQTYFDQAVYAPETGGSGERDIYVNSRWSAKLSGLFELPYGINLSGVFTAREGYVRPTYTSQLMPGIGTDYLYGEPGAGGQYGDVRLPNYYILNLRLEKTFPVFEVGRVALAVDAFNLLNSAHPGKMENSVGSEDFELPLQILNPRVFRAGVRFTF
ncbi:MAG: carboxypeptidase regulatory-like domain-containing protein [Candidatus Aminicenantaceae bacterium]